MLAKLLIKVKQKLCDHEFLLKDLEWHHYYRHLYTSEGHTKRVKWKCHKCEKVFYAHCGLDIAPEHGFIVGRNAPHDRGWEER